MSWITMMRVVTHLQPDVLLCEVKWALGSMTTNKVSGADGIPVEVFQMPKELWTEVCNTVQKGRTKAIPKRKKGKEAKRLSEEAYKYLRKEKKGKARENHKDIPNGMQGYREQQEEIRPS